MIKNKRLFFVYRFAYLPADPIEFWKRVHKNPKKGYFLQQGHAGPRSKQAIFLSIEEPVKYFSGGSIKDYFRFYREVKKTFNKNIPDPFPVFIGFLGFEAGRIFDPGIKNLPKFQDSLGSKLFEFGQYASGIVLDFEKNETVVYASKFSTLERIRFVLESAYRGPPIIGSLPSSAWPKVNTKNFSFPSKKHFSRMVALAKSHIRKGDIYQANISLRFKKKGNLDPRYLFSYLSQRNPSPYAACLKTSTGWIVSSSPELLLAVEGKIVRTRPIAGTRPRSKDPKKDNRRRGQLLLSPKEQAEHIMLVDLERNDLGRVCRPGSVKVSQSMAVEKYSHVMHIVSQVEGKLDYHRTSLDAVAALFPGGTITGCPKISAIKIIQEAEQISRGPFYGSVGYFSPNGDAMFNILIRTLFLKKNTITFQAGAGIVADSHPDREYREVLAKALIMMEGTQAGLNLN